MTRRSGEVAPVVGENAETASSVRAGDELEGAPDINSTITGDETKGIIIILERPERQNTGSGTTMR